MDPKRNEALANGAEPAQPPARYPWLKTYPKNVDWNAPLKGVPLQSLLEKTAADHGSRVCSNFMGKTLTYAEINGLANKVAAGLQKRGVRKGVNVGLLLPNTPTFIIFYYGILKAGGTVVNFNPLYTIEELSHQARDARLQMMVTLDLAALFPKARGRARQQCGEFAGGGAFRAALAGAQIGAVQAAEEEGRRRLAAPRRMAAGSSTTTISSTMTASPSPVADRSAERRRRAAIYRRHHRHAERRDADARQSLDQRAAGDALGARSRAGRRAGDGHSALLPCVRDDVGDELRHRQGGDDDPRAALRAESGAEADPQGEADGHARRPDAL